MGGINKSIRQLLTGFGIGNARVPNPSALPSSDRVRKKFTAAEFEILAKRHYVKPAATMSHGADPAQLISYLSPTHEGMVRQVQDIERIRALCPEIGKAESILVSSVMSPNDLQSVDPDITIDEYDGLPEEVIREIEELLTQTFAKKYRLGKSMEEWAREALFRSGAAVSLVLPEATLAQIVGTVSEQGTEALNSASGCEDVFMRALKKKIYSPQSAVESFLVTTKQEEKPAVSSSLIQEIKDLIGERQLKTFEEETTGVESVAVRMITELEDGDILHLSENPEILRFGKKIREYGKNKLGKDLSKFYDQSNREMKERDRTLNVSPDKLEPVIDLTPFITSDSENMTDAYILKLPCESVIPICIPGAPKEKLGYFVLIDAFGQPIEASKYLMTYMGGTTSNMVSAQYKAMFGGRPTASGVQNNRVGSIAQFGTPWDMQQSAITNVFNHVLDAQLKKKLSSIGLSEVEIGAHNNIAACMLYRLLQKKRTALVFVPSEVVTYVAFDYHANGTGKSRIEDIMYLLSVKTTIVIANMMAAMRNSVARKDIEITVDEKETNAEGIREEVRQAVIAKYKLNLDSDPTSIAQSIINQNMTIKLKGTNAAGFDISAQDTQSNVPKADTDLLDQLTNGIVTHLGPPYSVMNETSQQEFAKSVATTNMFFANDCRTLQSTLCEITASWCRTVIRFSPSLKKQLLAIIQGATKKHAEKLTAQSDPENPELSSVPNTLNDGAKDSTNTQNAIAQLGEILQHLKVKLPLPNISPDKAQGEVFSDYIRLVNDFVDAVLPNELVASDSDLSDVFNVFKARVRADLVMELGSSIGINSIFDVPDWEDYFVNRRGDIANLFLKLRNLKAGLDKDKVATTTPTETEDGTDSGSAGDTGSDSSSSDYGSNDDFGF